MKHCRAGFLAARRCSISRSTIVMSCVFPEQAATSMIPAHTGQVSTLQTYFFLADVSDI